MTPRTVFTPEAEQHLIDLYRYIAASGYPEAAAQFTDSIVGFCEDIAALPLYGKARDDIRPGLRVIGYRRRVVIAFVVQGEVVVVVGIFYGGRDYETVLAEPEDLQPL